MRLTHFTDYALRVLMYLGSRARADRLSTIGDIATAYGISENHLMKVVHHLARHGYIETTRGKGGGMKLARAPEMINIGEVVRGTEDDFALVECFGPNNGDCRCPIVKTCALSGTLAHALDTFFRVLDAQTLADAIKPRGGLGGSVPKSSNPRDERAREQIEGTESEGR
ncbi:MAG TPA: Rrf2 family transcriptional regulator [Burkholderiales bacterium]|nr:Rrf2 family transcriptional regulator [Burkholderiales bacterium]